jgi:hypothetical protein
MSKKKNNRLIYIVFIVLLVLVGINELVKATRGERTFRKDVIDMKAEDITGFTIHPKNVGAVTVNVFKDDSVWKLKVNDKPFAADQDMIKGIVDQLAAMRPEQLVANRKELWKDYDITDSLGVKVEVHGKGGKDTRLTLGRFSYNQGTRKPSTFIRIDDDKDVYAVEGYLGLTLNREINSLRDKNIFRANRNDLTQISFTYPADSSFTLTKGEDNRWLEDGVPVDSAKMSNWLNAFTYLFGENFRDDFVPADSIPLLYKVVITGKDMKPVEIRGYRDSKGTVINSSVNPTSYFSGDVSNLYYRIFQRKTNFFASPADKKKK